MYIYNKLKNIALVLVIIIMGSACTGDFEELNTSPTLVTEELVQPTAIFTSVLKNSIYESFTTSGRVGEFSSYFHSQSSGNLFTPADYTTPFSWYRSYVINLNEILRLTAEDPQRNDLRAMARIWKVWVYHIITDSYGDIPYVEAAKDVQNVINQPVYDTQEAIYTDLLKELDEAAAQLGSVGDQISVGSADILFQGNTESWVKFANSLRLRLAIRIRFADAALASQHINDVINAPLIDENSENAFLKTLQPSATEDPTNLSWIYNTLLVGTSDVFIFVGFGITDVMIPTDDPRLPVYFTPGLGGTYRGRPIQLAQEQKPPYGQDTVATIGPVLMTDRYDIIIFNAAETWFLKAEAALANIASGDAGALYVTGIERAMEQYGIDQAEVTEFLANPGVVYGGTEEERFEKIVTQKYIAMFFQMYQGWAEYRRTGFPRVWLGNEVGAATNIPRRLTYPEDEYLKNEVNVTAAASRLQGGDEMDSKIWWDKRPGLPLRHPRQDIFPPN